MRTCDLPVLDADCWAAIAGRSRDMIIRCGAIVHSREIEDYSCRRLMVVGA